MEETPVIPVTPTPGEAPVAPLPTPGEHPSPKLDTAQLEATNKELFARAKKAEDEVKRLRDEHNAPPAPAPRPDLPPQSDDIEAVLQLRSEGFSDKEILSVRAEARKLRTSVADLLQNETFKAGIEAQRAKARVESAQPAPSNHSPKVDGKTFRDMKPEEREKHFSPEAWRARKTGTMG